MLLQSKNTPRPPWRGSKARQDAALAHLASNADDIAVFLNGANPYLPKEAFRILIAAHGAHHVLQINLYKKKDYTRLEATWPMGRDTPMALPILSRQRW